MQIIQGYQFAEHFICFKPELTEMALNRYKHESYYTNTLNCKSLSHSDIIYCKIDFVEELFKIIKDVEISYT